jgi:hypothetical protein
MVELPGRYGGQVDAAGITTRSSIGLTGARLEPEAVDAGGINLGSA